MQTFYVRRRGIAGSANELDRALTRLRDFEDGEPGAPVHWLHSYALREPDGRFGLACLCEAQGVLALHAHAARTGLPADEIVRVGALKAPQGAWPAPVWLLRRRQAWADTGARDAALAGLPAAVWCCYALDEADGGSGHCSLVQAADPRSLAALAGGAGPAAAEVVPVLGRIVFRAASNPDAAPLRAGPP